MPSSTWAHTSTVQDLVWKYQPKTVLDVGIGWGRWGFLIREQMDVFKGHYPIKKWKTHITGIEIWSQYIMRHHKDIYDDLYVGDVETFLERNPAKTFDFIVAGDVIEHLEKEKGQEIIAKLRERSNKAVVICIPLGPKYPQGAALGNPYEEHKSVWTKADFADATRVLVIKERIKQRPYGVVLYQK